MELRFVNYRRLDASSSLTEMERAQVESRGILSDSRSTEADVVDGDAVVFQGYFSPYGSAVFFRANTVDVAASAAQHSLDSCTDFDVWDALGRAYRDAIPKIEESIDFRTPVRRVEDATLGWLEFDDEAHQWHVDIDIEGRFVEFWICGELEPYERALADAKTAIERFAALTLAARRKSKIVDGEIVDVGIWKPGIISVDVKGADRVVTVEIPVAG